MLRRLSAGLWHSSPAVELPWPWIAFVANTGIVFGFLIAWFREEWTGRVFWVCLTLLFMAHAAVYIAVLTRIHALHLIYYLLLNHGELAVFESIVEEFVLRYGD